MKKILVLLLFLFCSSLFANISYPIDVNFSENEAQIQIKSSYQKTIYRYFFAEVLDNNGKLLPLSETITNVQGSGTLQVDFENEYISIYDWNKGTYQLTITTNKNTYVYNVEVSSENNEPVMIVQKNKEYIFSEEIFNNYLSSNGYKLFKPSGSSDLSFFYSTVLYSPTRLKFYTKKQGLIE